MKEANFFKGKRVLVTGGLGFIGSNAVHSCLAQGAEVTVYDCLDPKSGGNMANVADIQEEILILRNDVRQFDGIAQSVVKQDVVINCAAYTSHPKSMEDPLTDIDVNCKGVMYLLEAMRRFNPKAKLVHVGTSTQIGRMQQESIDELHPEFPLDIYSANKTASEKYVLVYATAYGMDCSVVRLVNVFGPRSNIRSSEFGFINYFIGLSLQGKPVPVYGDGEQIRSILYVDDAVSALLAAAASEKSKGEIFFAASDKHATVKEIAETITACMGGSVQSIPWPKHRHVIEVGDAIVSNKKIKETLDWQPQDTLVSGLEKTKKFYSTRLESYL